MFGSVTNPNALPILKKPGGAGRVTLSDGSSVEDFFQLGRVYPAIAGEVGVVAKEYPPGNLRRYGIAYNGADEGAELANAFASAIAANVRLYADETKKTVITAQTITANGAGMVIDLDGITIQQDDAAELSTVLDIDLSGGPSDDTILRVAVDGNNANNTAAVTGVRVNNVRDHRPEITARAYYCDTGIAHINNTEGGRFVYVVERCGTGVLEDLTTGVNPPQENHIAIYGHLCDTFYHKTNQAIRSVVEIYAEQSYQEAIKIDGGETVLKGFIRGACNTAGYDAIAITGGDVDISRLHVWASSTADGWGLRVDDAVSLNGDIRLNAFAKGAWIKTVDQPGGLRIKSDQKTMAGHHDAVVKLGDSATTTRLSGYSILEGSSWSGVAGTYAVVFDYTESCIVSALNHSGIGNKLASFAAGSICDYLKVSRRHRTQQIDTSGSAPRVEFFGAMTDAERATIPNVFEGMEMVNRNDNQARTWYSSAGTPGWRVATAIAT